MLMQLYQMGMSALGTDIHHGSHFLLKMDRIGMSFGNLFECDNLSGSLGRGLVDGSIRSHAQYLILMPCVVRFQWLFGRRPIQALQGFESFHCGAGRRRVFQITTTTTSSTSTSSTAAVLLLFFLGRRRRRKEWNGKTCGSMRFKWMEPKQR